METRSIEQLMKAASNSDLYNIRGFIVPTAYYNNKMETYEIQRPTEKNDWVAKYKIAGIAFQMHVVAINTYAVVVIVNTLDVLESSVVADFYHMHLRPMVVTNGYHLEDLIRMTQEPGPLVLHKNSINNLIRCMQIIVWG